MKAPPWTGFTVNGPSPRSAQRSTMYMCWGRERRELPIEVADFVQAVNSENKKTLAGIPGVSQRNAEHIIADLRGKLDDYSGNVAMVVDVVDQDIALDAESALIGLGYKPKEASLALAQVEGQVDDVESLIRLALKQLMKT